MPDKKLTNAAGAPVADNTNSTTAGPRGPMTLQNPWFIEKMAHFDREVIPERRMHAKGSGAFGTFTVTHDITKYTKAQLFSEVGKQTEMFVRLMRLAYEDKHLQLMDWAESAAAMGRESQKRMLENILRLLRDSYMLSMGMPQVAYLHGRELDFCRKFAPFVNNVNIERLLTETESVAAHIVRNGNPKIIFTHYVLTVSKLISVVSG